MQPKPGNLAPDTQRQAARKMPAGRGMAAVKPDWSEAESRMRDWWAGRRTDRAVAGVYAPKEGAPRKAPKQALPDKYTDFATLTDNFESQMESTFYGGEAFPAHWLYHGPVPISAYFGGTPEFRPDTVWYAPCHADWDAARNWSFDPGNRWWRMALDLTRRSLEHAQGRYLVSGCGIGALADVIANLWGVEALLMQAADEPAVIRDLLGRMLTPLLGMYDELYELARPYQEGYFDWMYMWAPGRVCSLQNDVSCMMSPGMFREIFLDEIRREAEHVDYAIYHLDGPGAIKHLDALLGIEALRVIQWQPGAGASMDPMDWLDLLRRIHAAGKKTYVICPPERVRDLLARVDRQAVYLRINCRDEKSAHACLAELDRIGG